MNTFLVAGVAMFLTLSSVVKAEDRYFRMSDGNPKDDFIFLLNDPAKIKEAEAIIRCHKDKNCGNKPIPHVNGIIVKAGAPYNPIWTFHYDPKTISFPELTTEVCDAETSYVQEHLADVGKDFLPGNRWCPWGQRVVEDVTASVSPRK